MVVVVMAYFHYSCRLLLKCLSIGRQSYIEIAVLTSLKGIMSGTYMQLDSWHSPQHKLVN